MRSGQWLVYFVHVTYVTCHKYATNILHHSAMAISECQAKTSAKISAKTSAKSPNQGRRCISQLSQLSQPRSATQCHVQKGTATQHRAIDEKLKGYIKRNILRRFTKVYQPYGHIVNHEKCSCLGLDREATGPTQKGVQKGTQKGAGKVQNPTTADLLRSLTCLKSNLFWLAYDYGIFWPRRFHCWGLACDFFMLRCPAIALLLCLKKWSCKLVGSRSSVKHARNHHPYGVIAGTALRLYSPGVKATQMHSPSAAT